MFKSLLCSAALTSTFAFCYISCNLSHSFFVHHTVHCTVRLKVILDGANGASSDVSRKLSDLDSAIRETRGPFGGDELARAKASHSKLSRDYQRIRSTHDGLLQRSSETANGSTDGNAVSSSSGNGSNLWSHDEPPLESPMHGGDKAELIMEREVRDSSTTRLFFHLIHRYLFSHGGLLFFMLVSLSQEEYSKQVMQSREDDIQQINQKMNKVNEIYKDLGNLVGSQQDQIDEIEDAAADADSRAANGLDQLQRANRPWFGGKKQPQQEAEAAEKSWSDSIMDSMKEMKSDMDAIGNDVAKKSKASILAAQMMFCGAFGGGAPYGASSD